MLSFELVLSSWCIKTRGVVAASVKCRTRGRLYLCGSLWGLDMNHQTALNEACWDRPGLHEAPRPFVQWERGWGAHLRKTHSGQCSLTFICHYVSDRCSVSPVRTRSSTTTYHRQTTRLYTTSCCAEGGGTGGGPGGSASWSELLRTLWSDLRTQGQIHSRFHF